jgi:hypothetical protein
MTDVSGMPGTRKKSAPRRTESVDIARPLGPRGEFVLRGSEAGYEIRGYDRMPPFLISLPTDTDLWMFISSSGGVTAGRRDPDGALLPYETVDRLHDAHSWAGPLTLLRIRRDGGEAELWEPFASRPGADPAVERTLFKNVAGNRLVFTEYDSRRELAFHMSWCGSDATGWVRTVTLENRGDAALAVEVLDGVRDLMPYGAPLALQQHSSCLVDAYKRVDVDPFAGLAIASLTSRVSDRPEPAESLRATTAWCHGLPGHEFVLSLDSVEAFRRGETIAEERVLTGRRTNAFVHAQLEVAPRASATWYLALDTGRTHLQIANLRAKLLRREELGPWIEQSLTEATQNLERIVASSDGLQAGERTETTAHHFANVLFNDLRGGVFVQDHEIPTADLAAFMAMREKAVAERHAAWLASLPATIDVAELHLAAARTDDPAVRRLCLEYLPLYFGRRHGDPSRPWNKFRIQVRDADGARALRYEGNWRDVFQNWEALSQSFPGFLPNMIARFVNASTVDGFNPYRISRDGIDWEVLDPENPWSGIGYWGDHQIIYLLRLLEQLRRTSPGTLEGLLSAEIFTYADVPYRLRPYADMLIDPRATILYDAKHARAVEARVAQVGQDGKLVHGDNGAIRHVSLLEKLLVPVLSKWSCFVPGAGIWMNTERPEWNDANNALVGNGVSAVTLYQLARHLVFLEQVLGEAGVEQSPVTGDVAAWMREVAAVAERYRPTLTDPAITEPQRAEMMDALGEAFTRYREQVYAHGLGASENVATTEILAFLSAMRAHIEFAVHANRRDDGLYHSYHVLERDGAGARLRPLAEMLEGQVAVLGSGMIGGEEAIDMLTSLFASPLYRADQQSFLLYPDRQLPTFLDRNRVPEARAMALPLVVRMLESNEGSILDRDAFGVLRFQADLANVRDLHAALDGLAGAAAWREAVAADRDAVAALYVDTFGHRTYTGRSGTMYAYEGLGSIYWHMVAKLLVAVQECVFASADGAASGDERTALLAFYDKVRAGLGFAKTPAEYGAFPSDPYSHTPAHAGAQQPGMTGQVKEEILTRFGELGVRVNEGLVHFAPVLLKRDEFLAAPREWTRIDRRGTRVVEALAAHSLAFTLCQTPVFYRITQAEPWVRITRADGSVTERAGQSLDGAASASLLARDGAIARIEVGIPENHLRQS